VRAGSVHGVSARDEAKWEFDLRFEGEVVALEPLEQRHVEGLLAAGRAEEIWTWWPVNPAESRGAMDEWVGECLAAPERGERQHYVTLDAATGEVVGSTSYCLIERDNRVVEIGWTFLTPSRWRTGANTEAKLLMLRHAFETLGCQRVQIVTDARNERSRAAIAALPAQFEGIHRDDRLLRDGTRRSSAFYSILDREWPAVESSLNDRMATRAMSDSDS
jgi:RimJ/RimL family protein N-acetyltransferase